MTPTLILIAVVIAIIAIGVPLERRRQKRLLARRGELSKGTRAVGAGLLGIQEMLQADRHIVTLERQQKREEIAQPENDEDAGPPQP